MPFPPRGVPIALTSATPTELTVDKLKDQLTNIGLTCDQAAIDLLAGYIAEVKDRIPNPSDGAQAWSILQHERSNAVPAAEAAALPMFESASGLIQSSIGNWEPSPTAMGYASELEYIQYTDHFQWLKEKRPGFLGQGPRSNHYSGSNMTVDAIKQQFEEVGVNASASLVNGLDRKAIESALSNAIAPLNEAGAKDYKPGPDSRVFFLVENYNPQTGMADGIGVLTVQWNLTITDYTEKKGPIPLKHNYDLTVDTWSVVYDDPNVLDADFAAVKAAMKTNAFLGATGDQMEAFPPKPTAVKIFPAKPPANEDTFNSGIPVVATGTEAKVMVLYAPDLESIGSIDNTASKATAGYSKAVTNGFTFSTTQELTITASAEVDVIVAKAGISVGLSFSFTEEWNTSTTETIEFDVPPGEKAFFYQGFMMATVLTFDAKTGTYSFGGAARCLTPVLVTNNVPIVGQATMPNQQPQRIEQPTPTHAQANLDLSLSGEPARTTSGV